MQAGGPGHIPGETPGLGAKFAQLAPQLRLGAGEANPANSLSFPHHSMCTGCRGEGGVVVRLPESWSGNPARRKALPAGG